MQFKTGQTVVRHDPGGHEGTFSVQNEQDVKYHSDLSTRGYKYTDITKPDALDFELPAVQGTVATAPRIHIGGSTCIGCEG